MKTMNRMVSADEIYRALLNGKNSYLRMSRSESSHFDPSWIKVIEDCLYDLGEIVNNPYQVTKSEGAVVPVELAKKIDGESVQHLASHSQYVKEITEQGDVVPSKILSHYNEDNIHIYENRFIATFIRRLVLFIEKRYEFVIKTIPLYKDDVMIMKNTSVINGQQVEIETKIKVKRETDDDVGKAARAYADRIIKMRDYVTYYYNSSFMRQMKNERDVKKPILQTNIIRKNPKYRHCYEAFMFIERFDALGVTYKVAEDYLDFDAKTRAEMNYLFFATYLSLKDNKAFNKVKTNDKIYKPRILTSMDDEEFVYGPYLKGPIEFVRVDEPYRKYLLSKMKKNLPVHPTKQEKEFYKDEYAFNKELRDDDRELEKLIARKQREIAKFEKQVAKIVAQREKEEAELEKLRQKEIKDDEDRRIEAKRQEIIDAARARQEELDAEIEREKEELARLQALMMAAKEQEAAMKAEEEPKEEKNEPQEEIPEVLDTPEETEEVPEEEPVVEEESQHEEEPIVEETPVEEPAEEPQPEEQPVEAAPVEEPQEEVVPEQPAEEEQPVEEEKPAPKKRGRKKKVVEEVPVEEPQPEQQFEEPVPEESPVEEEPVNEQPQEEPNVEDMHEELPVEEPIEEIPAEEPQPVEEEKQEEEPKRKFKVQFRKRDGTLVTIYEKEPGEEQPAPKKVNRKKKAAEEPKEEPVPEEVSEPIQEEPVVEEAPVEEPQPVEEQPVEEPVEQPVVEEPAPAEEPVIEAPQEEQPMVEEPKNSKPRPKKAAKKAKAPKEEPKAEKAPRKPKVKEEEQPAEVIPGRFVVKTYDGYYVKENKFSIYKKDAKIFDDFNVARQIKARFGGKVVKL